MNNKKVLIGLSLLLIIGIVGITFAYFANSTDVSNEFNTDSFGYSIYEEFISPDNWVPGTTTANNVYGTNKGDTDLAVRVSYIESWTNGSNSLPLVQIQGEEGNETEVVAAIINFTSDIDTKWIQSIENGTKYYYYYKKLSKNENTSSIINSVTFNQDIIANEPICEQQNIYEDNDTEYINPVGTQLVCDPDGTGYDGATYTLTVRFEFVPFKLYKQSWNTNVNISE